MIYLSQKKNVEEAQKLINKYYNKKNISFYDKNTGKYRIQTVKALSRDSIQISVTKGNLKTGKSIKPKLDIKVGLTYLEVLPKRLKTEVLDKIKTKKDLLDILSKTFFAELSRGTIKTIKGTFNVGKLIDDYYKLNKNLKKYNKINK